MYITIGFLLHLGSNKALCFFWSDIFEIDCFRNVDIEIFPLEKWAKSSLSLGIADAIIGTDRGIGPFFLLDDFYGTLTINCMRILSSRYRDKCFSPLHIGAISTLSDDKRLVLI